MTFFNKKTEVMQIEMTPYGRYLYSIGKFKPYSYEFVDDDIIYKIEAEDQMSAHGRILNETPRLKTNRNFQVLDDKIPEDIPVHIIRENLVKMDQKIPNERSLAKSSYSSTKSPSFEVSTLLGDISNAGLTYNLEGTGSSINIPQIDIDFKIFIQRRSEIEDPQTGYEISTRVFEDSGEYLEIEYENKMLLIKELNSFYEKENFELEVFLSGSSGEWTPLKMLPKAMLVKDEILQDESQQTISNQIENPAFSNLEGFDSLSANVDGFDNLNSEFVEYFFSITLDEDIPNIELCNYKDQIKVNNQFLDKELDCPDIREDRFNLYDSDVDPNDLEDCD